MSNYDETNRGAIWPNDKREKETHPHFRGSVNVDGREYWVAAWKRGPDDNPKAPSLKFSLTAKDEQPSQPQKTSAFVDEDINDDIPF